jgi:hypothetical protein
MRGSYFDLLETMADRNLIANVPPIQLAIRLLIPFHSRLLELPEIANSVGEFDCKKLVYPWQHSDPALDSLANEIAEIVASAETKKATRSETFERIWGAAARLQEFDQQRVRQAVPSKAAPFLSEPWYC